MLLLEVMVAFHGRNLRGDSKINYPRFKKLSTLSLGYLVEPMFGISYRNYVKL